MSTNRKRKPRTVARPPLKVMVASTVYNFETELDQVCGVLKGYGYHVLNSHLGTIPVDPDKDNLGNCLTAVDSCDLMFGIVRPFYGSGVVGPRSITHEEMRRAVAIQKPRWFVVHSHVPLARQILKQYRFDGANNPIPGFTFQKTGVLDDVRVIDMYDDVTAPVAGAPPTDRHWAQGFTRLSDILTHIEAQFRDVDRIRAICERHP